MILSTPLFAGLVIGCGDGTSGKKRGRISVGTKKATPAQGPAKLDVKNGGSTQAAQQLTTAQITELSQTVANSGQTIELTDLKVGTYKLSHVVQMGKSDSNQDATIHQFDIQEDSQGQVQAINVESFRSSNKGSENTYSTPLTYEFKVKTDKIENLSGLNYQSQYSTASHAMKVARSNCQHCLDLAALGSKTRASKSYVQTKNEEGQHIVTLKQRTDGLLIIHEFQTYKKGSTASSTRIVSAIYKFTADSASEVSKPVVTGDTAAPARASQTPAAAATPPAASSPAPAPAPAAPPAASPAPEAGALAPEADSGEAVPAPRVEALGATST